MYAKLFHAKTVCLGDLLSKTTSMKKSNLYTLSALALSALLWLANGAGAGIVQGIDRTGSPLSPGACDACHSGGNFNPGITAELLDGAAPVTQYQPNRTYTLRVRITTSIAPSRYGFQAVALTGATNSNAGAFGAAPAGFRKTTIQGREYAEQNSPRTSNTMDFPWTSPATPGENIRFFAAGIASNNNGGSNGDAPVKLLQPLVISPLVSSSAEATAQRLRLRLWGNPVGSALRLSLNNPEAGMCRFALYRLDGSLVWKTQQWLSAGEQMLEWDTVALPAGLYTLSMESPSGITALKIVK